jgi:hypothetical protein
VFKAYKSKVRQMQSGGSSGGGKGGFVPLLIALAGDENVQYLCKSSFT